MSSLAVRKFSAI